MLIAERVKLCSGDEVSGVLLCAVEKKLTGMGDSGLITSLLPSCSHATPRPAEPSAMHAMGRMAGHIGDNRKSRRTLQDVVAAQDGVFGP